MKVFIAIKYDKESLALVSGIKEIISSLGHTPYCFAQDEGYIADEKEMMKRSFQKIIESDLILVEASQPSFGVGIESGYAFATNKRIVTIANKLAKVSTTLKGVSDSYITYKNFNDLSTQLKGSL